MTAIDRTAYPRLDARLTSRELAAPHELTATELDFVRSHARGQAGRLILTALLKSRQDLGYFPPPDAFPDTILTVLASQLGIEPANVEAAGLRGTKSLYRYHAAISRHVSLARLQQTMARARRRDDLSLPHRQRRFIRRVTLYGVQARSSSTFGGCGCKRDGDVIPRTACSSRFFCKVGFLLSYRNHMALNSLSHIVAECAPDRSLQQNRGVSSSSMNAFGWPAQGVGRCGKSGCRKESRTS
jgi:Domain of unknown function (DUF4158)